MTLQFVVRCGSSGDRVLRMDGSDTGIDCTRFADDDYGPALVAAGEAKPGDVAEFMSQTVPGKVLDTVEIV